MKYTAKRTSKGYLYRGYELNRVIDKNMMTLCNQMWGWKVLDPDGKDISPHYFDRLYEAKEYVDKLNEGDVK